jgi:hypothetical protein
MSAKLKKSMAALAALILVGALVRLVGETSPVALGPAARPLWRN